MNLIFLHGALGSNAQWEDICKLLPNTFNIHCINFPQHGNNETILGNYSIETLANTVEQYIETKQLQKCILIGYSLGGYVALWLAAKNPDYLLKVITLATKFTWDNDAILFESKKLSLENLLPIKERLIAMHVVGLDLLLLITTQIIASIAHNYLNEKVLSNINSPVLLMVGEIDKMVSQQETKQYGSFIKNAKVEILPLQPHLINKMESELIVKYIVGFII